MCAGAVSEVDLRSMDAIAVAVAEDEGAVAAVAGVVGVLTLLQLIWKTAAAMKDPLHVCICYLDSIYWHGSHESLIARSTDR